MKLLRLKLSFIIELQRWLIAELWQQRPYSYKALGQFRNSLDFIKSSVKTLRRKNLHNKSRYSKTKVH